MSDTIKVKKQLSKQDIEKTIQAAKDSIQQNLGVIQLCQFYLTTFDFDAIEPKKE